MAPPSLCPSSSSSDKGLKSGKAGGGGAKTAGEVSFQGRKGPMYLHPMMVTFDRKELDSRYGVYHEVVKTSKVSNSEVMCRMKCFLDRKGLGLRMEEEQEEEKEVEWLLCARP